LHRLLHDKEPGRSAGFVGAGLPQLDQLALKVGLQSGVVVTLGGSYLFGLFLQHAALMLSSGIDFQHIGLGDERVVLGPAPMSPLSNPWRWGSDMSE